MTQFLKKSFSVAPGQNKTFRDNWDAVFRKKPPRVDRADKRPPPPETLAGALQDTIHATSGRLRSAKPVRKR